MERERLKPTIRWSAEAHKFRGLWHGMQSKAARLDHDRLIKTSSPPRHDRLRPLELMKHYRASLRLIVFHRSAEPCRQHIYIKLTGNVFSFLYCFGIPSLEAKLRLLHALFKVIIKSRTPLLRLFFLLLLIIKGYWDCSPVLESHFLLNIRKRESRWVAPSS